jgi:hypothetical protein
MSRIPLHFRPIHTIQPGTPSLLLPGLTSSHPLSWVPDQQSCRRLSFSPENGPGEARKPLKEGCSCWSETNISMNPLQKIYVPRFFVPDSHKRIGEFGLSGRRHGRNVSDVDELQVLADRRRTERTSEGARRSRSPQMDISIMPLTSQKCSRDAIA